MMDIEIIDARHQEMKELRQLRGDMFGQWIRQWDALLPREKDIYSHPVYVMPWINARWIHVRDNIPLYVFSKDNTFIAAIPFVTDWYPFGKRIFRCLKSPLVELGSTLAVAERHHRPVVDTLFQSAVHGRMKPFAIVFNRIDETNSFLRSENKALVRKAGYTRKLLDLSQGYENLMQSRTASFRKNLRNKQNRAAKLGSLSLEIISEDEKIGTAFDAFVEFEVNGWKSGSIRAMRNNRFILDFYRDVICGFSRFGKTCIFNLYLDHTILASRLCIIVENVLYALKTAYNEQYAKLSPDMLILDRIFRDFCPPHGITLFNTMSESPWFKRAWEPDSIETYKSVVFKKTFWGGCIRALYKAST